MTAKAAASKVFTLSRRRLIASGTALGTGLLIGAPLSYAYAKAPVRSFHDPRLAEPYVDVDEWRDTPFRHRYVHGGFRGTEAKFLMLFPPKEQYGGRFFQHNTAIPMSEMQAIQIFGGDFGGFCADSGAIAVVSNQGGFSMIPQTGSDEIDPSLGSYGVSAATAMYARELAQEMYGEHRTYGYAFGGSGGAYRTFSGAEKTQAWDGVVPYIHGNAHSWPNSYAGRARVQRALKPQMARIADALEPGGGDVFAALEGRDRDILAEVTRLGFPVRTWVFNEAMGIGPLRLLFQSIQTLDPGYFSDFWTVPGHLGHDEPEAFDGVRLQHRVRVKRVIRSDEAAQAGLPAPPRQADPDPDLAWRTFQSDYGTPLPVALELESAPPAGSYLEMANIDVATGDSAGRWLVLGSLVGNIATLQFSPAGGSLREITEAIKPGDEVVINNSNILAYETYYRHALLGPEFYVGNQFRRADGTPIFPQRDRLIAYELMRGAAPDLPTGKFDCKMIVVQNLLDWDAHPWYADYYRNEVRRHKGADFQRDYRLYYLDYATHGNIPDPTRTIPFAGALQQALRDVAAWAEEGVSPPDETRYAVEHGQVVAAPDASSRKGIQPIVRLAANGGLRAEVRAGEPVTFTAMCEVPPGTGAIVSAEWAFETGPELNPAEDGRFADAEAFAPAPRVAFSKTHTFTQPGTYYPALRVHSQRGGDSKTPYARIGTLGRVRVVVS